MARLASDAQMGFYATSVDTVHKVLNKCIDLKNMENFHVLDACAGEGEVIESFNKKYGCTTYAVELNENRAKKLAEKNIDIVLNADALSGVMKSNTWVGINFLNPPYGTSSNNSRIEIDFVERWGLTTTVGGALILVINPSSADEKMAKALRLQGYRPINSFYDPENEDYKRFGQFFVILQKQMPNFRATENKFLSLFNNPIDINSDFEIEKLKLKTGIKPKMFKEINTPRWKVEKNLKKSNLKNLFFDELRSNGVAKKSIETPNQGQAAILIASGALNKEITLANGDRVILKGSSTKEKIANEQIDEMGNISSVKLIDHHKTVVYGLNLTHGQFVKFE